MNINCVGMNQESGFQGDKVKSRAAVLCYRLHSSHCPLTWWSSLFHLCSPSSPIHRVSPGSSSRSLKGVASLKTCSCGCNFGRGRGKKWEKNYLSVVFILSIYLFHVIHMASKYFHIYEIHSQNQARKVSRSIYTCNNYPVSGMIHCHF